MRDNPAPYWAAEHARALAPSPTGEEDGKPSPPKGPRTGAELWAKARVVKTQVTLTKRWHRDVNTWYKRLWLTCKGSHTLLAGLFYRGSVGFSRAQTVMILSNSVALPVPLPLPLPLTLPLTLTLPVPLPR